MSNNPWWKDNVDELLIGLGIGAVAAFAIIWLGEASVPIATSAITAMGVYLGARNKPGGGA